MKTSPLLDYLRSVSPVSDALAERIQRAAQVRKLPARKVLLREGEVARHIYFVLSGVVRGTRVYRGADVSTWFAIENQFATAFASFIGESPSSEGLQTLGVSTVAAVSARDWNSLYEGSVEGNRLGRRLTERYLVWLERRTMSLLSDDPLGRYRHLMAVEPELLRHVPLAYIASYLGIARETLSRVRAKL